MIKPDNNNTQSPCWSYARHVHDGKAAGLPDHYIHPTSVDAWRHRRMLAMALPLLEAFPGASWMTIGDGRYGCDANYLQQHGADALATSIATESLQAAQDQGYIRKFKAENAEHISAADAAFDFVLSKESYHHFPRPPVAFYEMLRIARLAVVLIEPIEDQARLLDVAKQLAKKILRGDATTAFEPCGNYLYRARVREFEKMMTALNGPCLAVKKFNDFYHPKYGGYESRKLNLGYVFTRLGIALQDVLCGLRLLNQGLAAIIVFKTPPPPELRRALRRHGFRIMDLPKNPYAE